MNRNPRKLIRIRVSEDQFKALQEACVHSGFSTIGDLTLQTMRRLVEAPDVVSLEGQSSLLWTRELANRLASLQAEVERLEILLNVKQ